MLPYADAAALSPLIRCRYLPADITLTPLITLPLPTPIYAIFSFADAAATIL